MLLRPGSGEWIMWVFVAVGRNNLAPLKTKGLIKQLQESGVAFGTERRRIHYFNSSWMFLSEKELSAV
jgi:hypothetical protein